MVSTVLSVSWKDHSVALTEVCKTLLDNNFLVDCTIAAEGQTLKAHRLILSACSPYFQMLFGDECEKHPIVILQDVLFDTLKAMIDFMYHGETQVPEENLEAFLALAETLQIKGLNDSPKKDRRKFHSDDAGRDARHCPPNEDQKNICEVQSISASHEDLPDNSSRQDHSYHSDVYTEVQSNCTVSLEGSNSSYEQVKPTSVIQSSQQQMSPLRVETSDTDRSMKHEPIHHVLLVPKHEQMDDDDDESDGHTQDMSESDVNKMDEESAHAFGEQHLNQYVAPSYSENANVLPGVYSMPQLAGPPDVQVLIEESPEECSSSVAAADALPQVLVRPSAPASSTQSHTADHQYLCDVCGDSFAAAGKLYQHKRKQHPDERPFRCDTCDASFNLRCHLSVHRRSHGARPYACDVCGDRFTQVNNLLFHKRKHAGKPVHRCDVCGRCFKQSQGLKSHSRKHTGERPYRCNVCGLTFPYPNSLKFHQRRHTGERPYLCDTCGMSFTQKAALRRHYLTHTGVKRFSCDVCGREFASNFTLTTHKRRHTGERPYHCEMCGDSFRQSGCLTAHIFSKHTSLGLGID